MGKGNLTEGRLLEAAGDVIFGRGEDYVRYVHGLRVAGTRAQASIQAKNVYVVELDWGSGELGADCTCPHFDKGFFCKHLVALGLAVIDQALPISPVESPDGVNLRDLVETLEASDLRDLVLELAKRDSAVDQFIRVRAAVTGALGEETSKALVENVKAALNVRGFIDYRRSFDVARSAAELLDGLESYFDSGASEVIRPALLRALTRLRAITGQADDSSGSIGNVCQRAADLYARACREGSPDPVALARWLAKFRDESPGWPETVLADFVEAFDERGLKAYRRSVEVLDEKYSGTEQSQRFEINRMLLELADHDGDVDRAISLLDDGAHTDFRGIVDRLREAGRTDEVLGWIDRAVGAGRISEHLGIGPFWLDPAEVADAYLAADRVEDAISVLRRNFAWRPGNKAFSLLLRYAESLGLRAEERDWALATATELAGSNQFSNGAVLVELALAEGDLTAAWAAAEQFGPGHQWRQLAVASEPEHPRQAADLHLGQLEEKLRHPDSAMYPEIAEMLTRMKRLYERAGDREDFAVLITQVRASYARRPALMSALDRRGL